MLKIEKKQKEKKKPNIMKQYRRTEEQRTKSVAQKSEE